MNKNIVFTAIFSIFLVFGVVFAMPQKAEALLLDRLFEDAPPGPHCLMMDCDNNNQNQPATINNITGSYNTNSFNGNTGSLNGSLNTAVTSGTGAGSPGVSVSSYTTVPTPQTTTSANYNYNYNTGGGTVYVPQPVYYNTPSYPVYSYTQPTYVQPTYYYSSPISVSCSANTTFSPVGSYVTWTAYPSGGYNSSYYGYSGYSYSWTGTDGLYGSSSSVSTYYNTPGVKYAWVTLYANGQSRTVQCSNAVTVGAPAYQQPIYHQPISYGPGLEVACAADTTRTRIGVPVTWTAEAQSGGFPGGYSYSWSGSGGLYGSQSSAVVTYTTTGTKTATVTVTAPNGQSRTVSCGNSVYVSSNVVAQAPTKPAPPVVVIPQAPAPTPTQAAVSILSLGNVPWGWVAILIILVLLGTIFYLIFNKKKI